MIICVLNFCYFVVFLKFGWTYLKFYNANFFPPYICYLKKHWSNLMENIVVYPFKRYITSPLGLSGYEYTILCTIQFINSMFNTCPTLLLLFLVLHGLPFFTIVFCKVCIINPCWL